MGITLVPKRHSRSDGTGTGNPGSVKAKVSALVWKLRCFDVTTIERRDDWKADAFATLVNNTLADIFGQNSQEYEENAVQSFDTLPPATDAAYPLSEVRRAYQKGINAAVRRLNLLLDTLDRKQAAAEGAPPAEAETGYQHIWR